MPDPLTANKFLAQPTRGSDVGVWDTPMNANSGIIDNSFGGATVIALSNSNVTLSPSQYQCFYIALNGTLSANVTLTFPGGVGSFYIISHGALTTGSSFTVTMQTTAAGAGVIGIPPGEQSHIGISGLAATPLYLGLPHVGSYWHVGCGGVPAWVSACTTPPYLNCNGASFSSAAYPQLATYLGGNTLPDVRGRALFALDQGTGRNGGVFLGGGGSAQTTISQANLPNVNLNANANPVGLNQSNIVQANAGFVTGALTGGAQYGMNATPSAITPTVTLPQYSLGGSGTPMTTISPAIVHGMTLIRAG